METKEKKSYLQPQMMAVEVKIEGMICSSTGDGTGEAQEGYIMPKNDLTFKA